MADIPDHRPPEWRAKVIHAQMLGTESAIDAAMEWAYDQGQAAEAEYEFLAAQVAVANQTLPKTGTNSITTRVEWNPAEMTDG